MKLKDLYENYQLKKSDNVVSTKDYTILEYDDCLLAIKPIKEDIQVFISPLLNSTSLSINHVNTLQNFILAQEKTINKILTANTGKTKYNLYREYLDNSLTMNIRDTQEVLKQYTTLFNKYNFDGYTDWYIPSINEIPNPNDIKGNNISFITMDFKNENNLQILEYYKTPRYNYRPLINTIIMRHDK